MNRKILSLIFVAALIVLNAGACSPQTTPVAEQPTSTGVAQVAAPTEVVQVPTPTNVPDVKIGSVWPMTGANATFGVASDQGAEIAVKQINDQGGIKSLGGAKLVLVKGDAQTDPTVTAAEIERIASEGDISAFVGVQASALTLAATEVTERYKIPLVGYSVSDNLTTRGFKYTFMISPAASVSGIYSPEFVSTMIKQYGKPEPKVAILYEDGPTGSTTGGAIRDEAIKLGLDVVLFQAYPTGFTDASPQILKIKQSGATIVMMASGLTDAVLIQRTLKEQNVNVTVIGSGVGHSMNEFGSTLGVDSDYVFVSEYTDIDMSYPGVAELGAEYKATYGSTMSPQALSGYECVWVVKEALEAAGSAAPQAVRDALAGLDLTSGPATYQMSGRVKFDATGRNTSSTMGMLMWIHGQLHTIWPENAATAKLVWPAPAWNDR